MMLMARAIARWSPSLSYEEAWDQIGEHKELILNVGDCIRKYFIFDPDCVEWIEAATIYYNVLLVTKEILNG